MKKVLTFGLALALMVVTGVPASAATGFTFADLRITSVVADLGETGTVTVSGRMSKSLYAAYPNGVVPRPTFTLRQSCAGGTVATFTGNRFTLPSYPIGHPVQDRLVRGPGNWSTWTVSWTLDPDLIGPSGFSLCSTAAATGPITVQSMTLFIWPGCACSNVVTKQGESLYVTVTVTQGHTEVGQQRR